MRKFKGRLHATGRRGPEELTPEGEGELAKMVSDRYHARRKKLYDVKRKYDVRIDDRSMEWGERLRRPRCKICITRIRL